MERAKRYSRMDHAMKVISKMALKMGLEHTSGRINRSILGTLRTMNLKVKAYSNGLMDTNTKACGRII